MSNTRNIKPSLMSKVVKSESQKLSISQLPRRLDKSYGDQGVVWSEKKDKPIPAKLLLRVALPMAISIPPASVR